MSADIEVAAMENANKPEQTGPEPCSDHVEPNQETFLAPAPSSPSDQVRYVLVLFQDFHLGNFGSLAPDLAVHLRRKLEDIITAPQENVQIDLWLESGGGNAHSAYKIAAAIASVRLSTSSRGSRLRQERRHIARSRGGRNIHGARR